MYLWSIDLNFHTIMNFISTLETLESFEFVIVSTNAKFCVSGRVFIESFSVWFSVIIFSSNLLEIEFLSFFAFHRLISLK